MRPRTSGNPSFLRPFWSQFAVPWVFSLGLLILLAVVRYYAVLGPQQARILFLIHCLFMWAMPFLFLTSQGRRQIGLSWPARPFRGFAFSVLAGAACGLAVFALGVALYGHSPDNWNLSIRDSFQIGQLRALMPPAAVFAVITLPAMILTPIGEEILFRGFIQQAFTLRFNIVFATWVNGLAFGLIHIHVHGLWRDAAGFHLRIVSGLVMVFALAGCSAVFTQCRLRSGSLFTAMAAHAACNLAMISAVYFRYAV
jgi:hypothetical protein